MGKGLFSQMAAGATVPDQEPDAVSRSLVFIDPEAFKNQAQVVKLLADLEEIENQVKAFSVKDEESASEIVHVGTTAKSIGKAIKAALDFTLGDVKRAVKETEGFAKLYLDKAAAIEATTKEKYGAWFKAEQIRKQEEERKRQAAIAEANRKLQEQADEANRKAAEEAKKTGAEAPAPIIAEQITVPVVKEQPSTTRAANGGAASVALIWTFEIEDKTAIPMQYLQPDEKAIRDAIRVGTRDIPGVRIFQTEQVRMRT